MKHLLVLVLGVVLFTGCSNSSAKFTVTSSIHSAVSASQAGLRQLLFSPEKFFAPELRSTVAGNVSSVTFRIRSFYLSTHTDCSNPVEVANLGSTGTDFDMVQSNTIFSGNPPDGTYQCFALGMDDIITWKPDATAHATNAGCDPNVADTFDIYRTDSGDSPNWKDINGANITATGSSGSIGRDHVFIWASSSTSALGSGALAPHANQTVGFSSALTVPGSAVFYADFTGKVAGDASTCDLNGVSFGFR